MAWHTPVTDRVKQAARATGRGIGTVADVTTKPIRTAVKKGADRVKKDMERGAKMHERLDALQDRQFEQMERMSARAERQAELELTRDLYKGHARELTEAHKAAMMERMGGIAQKGESVGHYIGRRGAGGVAVDAAKGTLKGVRSGFGKGMKTGLIGLGVIGGVAGLGFLASSWRKNRSDSSRDELANAAMATPEAIPPVMAAPDMMAMQNAQTMMGVPPQPGEHANRVLASRGMAPQMAGAGQPNMTVVPEEAVQTLGPSRT